VMKLFPPFLRYVTAFSIMTVIFGVALVLDIANGNMSVFSLNTTFGLGIVTGAALAVVAIALATTVVSPSARKMLRLTEEMVKNSSPPSPELPKAAERVRVSAAIVLVLLILVLVFMVVGTNGV